MSVGNQFKRIGETGAAIGLWIIVFWFFRKPKRILILFLIFITLLFSFLYLIDNRGETFFVNVNKLELLENPFGKVAKTLHMNDTLVFLEEMSSNWTQVAVGIDTLYFKDNFYRDSLLGYTYKIQKEPFYKWKALNNREVILNHPKGYLDIGGVMMKNGDTITVIDCLLDYDEVKFKSSSGSLCYIKVEYLKINWESILENYPYLNRENNEK